VVVAVLDDICKLVDIRFIIINEEYIHHYEMENF